MKNHKKTCPYTLVFLIKDSKILLMKRSKLKRINPDLYSGLGGKVENDETLFESVSRELQEESGLICNNLSLFGTLTIIDHLEVARVLYIYTGNNYSGTLQKECHEGVVSWVDIEKIDLIMEEIAPHQRLFIKQLITSDTKYYSGIVFCNKNEIIHYTDNTNC